MQPVNVWSTEGKTLFFTCKKHNAMKLVNLSQILICFPCDPMVNVHWRGFILIFIARICFSSFAGRFQLYLLRFSGFYLYWAVSVPTDITLKTLERYPAPKRLRV